MDRNGLYKFTDHSPEQYLLYLDDKGKWVETPKKVKPSTEMIIIFETE